MNRKSAFLTPLSLGITLFLLLALAIVIWIGGGEPFNPGRVTAKAALGQNLGGYASHAGFESRCSLCHQPFGKTQAELCNQCHQDVGSQITAQTGIHGVMQNSQNCAGCHPEHRGRNFDPTNFALAEFDHGVTGFPLIGKHADTACSACHSGGRYLNAPRECVQCHAAPQTHQNLYTQDCSVCHSTSAWKPAWIGNAPFEHNQASFSLVKHAQDYSGQTMTCASCHAGRDLKAVNLAGCISCHNQKDALFMVGHQAQYGQDCLQCHDGKDRMQGFQHSQVFVLDGGHQSLSCDSCHANQQFRGTPSACLGCHAEPSIHTGFFGKQCQDCHTTSAWKPAFLKVHAFPLSHGQDTDVACLNCHPSTYPEYTCYGCHDHQADEIASSHSKVGIDSKTLPNCASCHLDGTVHHQARKPGES